MLGCAVIRPYSKIDQELKPYYDQFIYMFNIKKTNILLTFGDTNRTADSAIGICNYFTNTVTINRPFWNNAPYTSKIALIWHELGHCLLFKDHDDTPLLDGCPASIMNSYLPSRYCLEKHWERYVNEFGRN